MDVPARCQYCTKPAELVTGAEVYPSRPDLAHKKFWRCVPCDARVGCHPDTKQPMGSLANANDRRWRQRAHKAFDHVWKSGMLDRTQAYRRLQQFMGMDEDRCHIGKFRMAECQRVMGFAHLVEHGD